MSPGNLGVEILGFLKTHGFSGALEFFAMTFFGALVGVATFYYMWFVRGQFPVELPPDHSMPRQIARLGVAAVLLYLAWMIVRY